MAIVYHPDYKNEGKNVNKAYLDKDTGLLFEPVKLDIGVYPALEIKNPETIKKLVAKGLKVLEDKKPVAPKVTPSK